tara:strand:+ start:1741 stop:2022 length:282 start_codon:yes stop_codon:yes gene_type:complete
MDKKQKYFNYVVDSFLKGIEIDHEQDLVKFPYGIEYSFTQIYRDNYFPDAYYNVGNTLNVYLTNTYGIRGHGETKKIWDMTIEKLRKIIWDNS